jgi:hypothetical protein
VCLAFLATTTLLGQAPEAWHPVALWLLLGIAALVTAFLLRPLVAEAGEGASRQRAERGRLRDLMATKEAVYAALKEIEFDRLTRKLDEVDYETLRARYRAQAMHLLREIDALSGGAGDRPAP